MTTLIKLGGSLVTDKLSARSFRRAAVQAIARQLLDLRALQPERRLVVGHGSGSFGHFEARKHNTIEGVRNADERLGFASVGAVASELGQLVLRELVAAGLPALRFPPSAFQIARDKYPVHLDTRPLALALAQGYLPLVHGDIALDESIGGTIISTEALFARLVEPLQVTSIILLGNVAGVGDQRGQVISHITADNLVRYESALGQSDGVDVTGGMRQKVLEMLDLAQRHPDLNIVIADGNAPRILRALLVDGAEVGTRISGTS